MCIFSWPHLISPPNGTNKVKHFSQAIDKLRLSSILEDAVTLKKKLEHDFCHCYQQNRFYGAQWSHHFSNDVERNWRMLKTSHVVVYLASSYDFTSVFNAHHDGFKSTFKQFTLQLVIRITYQTQPIS